MSRVVGVGCRNRKGQASGRWENLRVAITPSRGLVTLGFRSKQLLLGNGRSGAMASGVGCGLRRRDSGRLHGQRPMAAGKHDGEQQQKRRQDVGRPSPICVEPRHFLAGEVLHTIGCI